MKDELLERLDKKKSAYDERKRLEEAEKGHFPMEEGEEYYEDPGMLNSVGG